MIHWLVQSLADHPALERGEAPPGLLSPAEAARLAGLRVAKRRRDWVLGRWTAKHLLQSTLESEAGLRLPFSAFTVANDASGAPAVLFDARQLPTAAAEGAAAPAHASDPQGDQPGEEQAAAAEAVPGLAGLSLSISHADGQAFCAVTLLPGATVGADIECILPRPAQFAADYFTPAEITCLAAAPARLHDTLVTVIWSAKEAALKALHLGLSVDTRRVSCLVAPPADALDPVLTGYRWSRLTLHIEHAALEAAGRQAGGPGLAAAGWWQIMSNYALTMVLLSPSTGGSAA